MGNTSKTQEWVNVTGCRELGFEWVWMNKEQDEVMHSGRGPGWCSSGVFTPYGFRIGVRMFIFSEYDGSYQFVSNCASKSN